MRETSSVPVVVENHDELSRSVPEHGEFHFDERGGF